MKLFLLLMAIPALLSETCKSHKTDPATDLNKIPVCIQNRIDSIKKEPRWNPPAEVNEYELEGKRVFLFSSDCCDFFDLLYDSQCTYICAPHGGVTGKGDGKCPDFDQKAKHIRLVWKDEREK